MGVAPWLEVSLVLLLCGAAWLPVAAPLLVRMGWRPGRGFAVAEKLQLVLSLYLVMPLVLWGYGVWQGRPITTLGLRVGLEGWAELAAGFGLGCLGLVVLFTIERSAGWLRFGGRFPEKEALPLFGVALVVGAVEELFFRGFLLVVLAPYGVGGVLLAAAIFALLHLIWEPAGKLVEAVPQLPGLFAMALVLTEARVLAGGSLNLAWGLHAGWVWTMGLIDTGALVAYTGRAPAWLTGLGGRPLAGAMGLAFLGATAATLWLVPW